MASVDAIRVFRGIYGGFALAMSEADEGLHFGALPPSDNLAGTAFRLSEKLIEQDRRAHMPQAQQEFTGMVVALALLEHHGNADELAVHTLTPIIEGLWQLIGGRWSPAGRDNTG